MTKTDTTTEPSAAAMRAAEEERAMSEAATKPTSAAATRLADLLRVYGHLAPVPPDEIEGRSILLAHFIDDVTGLPALLAALEDCERAIADDDGVVAIAARTRARAALEAKGTP